MDSGSGTGSNEGKVSIIRANLSYLALINKTSTVYEIEARGDLTWKSEKTKTLNFDGKDYAIELMKLEPSQIAETKFTVKNDSLATLDHYRDET